MHIHVLRCTHLRHSPHARTFCAALQVADVKGRGYAMCSAGTFAPTKNSLACQARLGLRGSYSTLLSLLYAFETKTRGEKIRLQSLGERLPWRMRFSCVAVESVGDWTATAAGTLSVCTAGWPSLARLLVQL